MGSALSGSVTTLTTASHHQHAVAVRADVGLAAMRVNYPCIRHVWATLGGHCRHGPRNLSDRHTGNIVYDTPARTLSSSTAVESSSSITWSLTEAAAALRASPAAITATQLADNQLTHIQRSAALNDFITRTDDTARAAASASSARFTAHSPLSPLDGIPIAVKDNLSVSSARLTAGSRMLDSYEAVYDATAVQRLRAAGAVIVGKTNLDEFGMGSHTHRSHFGPTLHPLSPSAESSLSPGGSSGGSAAAVSAYHCYAALGSDTGGSVRLPAAYCGCVGFKPTYGAVSRYGLVSYASSMDCVGVMARNVTDVRAVWDVIKGRDEHDATSIDTVPPSSAPLADLTGVVVGVPLEYNVAELSDEARNAWREAIAAAEQAGATVVTVSLPHAHLALPVYYILATAEASSNLARYDGVRYGHTHDTSKSDTYPVAAGSTGPAKESLASMYAQNRIEGFGFEVQRRILLGTFTLSSDAYSEYYEHAQRLRGLIAADYSALFEQSVDALLLPSSISAAPTLQKLRDRESGGGEGLVAGWSDDVMTVGVSLAGLPALSVPAQMGETSRLPLGVQLVGRWREDERLLDVATVLEQAMQRQTGYKQPSTTPMIANFSRAARLQTARLPPLPFHGARQLTTSTTGARSIASLSSRSVSPTSSSSPPDASAHRRKHAHLASTAAANSLTSIEQLEASLVSPLPHSPFPHASDLHSSSSHASVPPLLSSSDRLPLVRRLVDAYLFLNEYDKAEKLLWRLCDEQTRSASSSAGGAASGYGGGSEADRARQRGDEETINAIRTLHNIVQVRERAVQASVQNSSYEDSLTSPSAVMVLLDELVGRYHSLIGSSTDNAVVGHPNSIDFIQAVAVAYRECGVPSKAEALVRSTLLGDERSHVGASGTTQPGSDLDNTINGFGDDRRYQYAMGHYFLAVAAYSPPGPPAHALYDWSTSEAEWKRALAYIDPLIARLMTTRDGGSPAAAAASASVSASDGLARTRMLSLWLSTHDNISEALWASGARDAAMATLKRSIDTATALLPSHDSDLLRSKQRLIDRLLLLSTTDDASEAKRACEHILRLEPRLLSIGFAPSLDELAHSFARHDHVQYAARLFQLSIAVREGAAAAATARGPPASSSSTKAALQTAARYNDLGYCELQLEQFTAAEEHCRRSLDLTAAIPGATLPPSAVTVHNLAVALLGLQRYDEAARELLRARQLWEEKYALEQRLEQKPSQQTLRNRDTVQGKLSSLLGQCYQLLNRFQEGVAEHKRAVEYKQRAAGDPASLAKSLYELGHVLLQADAPAEAIEPFERYAELAERLYGAEHSTAAEAQYWLALAKGGAGRMEEAVQHARQAVAQGERLHAVGAMQQPRLDAVKGILTALLNAMQGKRE